jgi:hypothetical protein
MLRIEIMSEMVITLAYGAPAKQDKTASGNPHSGSRRTRARCTRGTVNQTLAPEQTVAIPSPKPATMSS